MNNTKPVFLNVGGSEFTSTIRTLTEREEDSLLSQIVQVQNQQYGRGQSSGNPIFFDRSGNLFSQILEYLRNGIVSILTEDLTEIKKLYIESRYYRLTRLSEYLFEKYLRPRGIWLSETSFEPEPGLRVCVRSGNSQHLKMGVLCWLYIHAAPDMEYNGTERFFCKKCPHLADSICPATISNYTFQDLPTGKVALERKPSKPIPPSIGNTTDLGAELISFYESVTTFGRAFSPYMDGLYRKVIDESFSLAGMTGTVIEVHFNEDEPCCAFVIWDKYKPLNSYLEGRKLELTVPFDLLSPVCAFIGSGL